ncbi:predicted protein [Naegleria gruberi]|uniref:Predicted protein n=1 Tax=Naegleria gruberi TaxID=5762 RepID=D2V741_NAEGR|nr:uncharacterized protein NAEGRDRAFT_64662 [Naegleria gruberi]EFC47193.1 predicted protein [Naegleria gruberi]|eukprot:XP_002679937.1 predicted protein [Naegleria gruberi strain NEG-M]
MLKQFSASSSVKCRNCLHHIYYWRFIKNYYSRTIVLSDERKDSDDQAISSLLNKLHGNSSFNQKREDLLKHSGNHKSKKSTNAYLEALEQEEFGKHIKTNDEKKQNVNSEKKVIDGSKASRGLMSTLQTLKSKNQANVQQVPNDDFITSQPKQLKANHVFRKHFRQEKTNIIEMNDLDEKWTKYVVDKDGSIPDSIRKHLSPIEVDSDKLTEEEQIQVFSKGYSEWINPDHKQKNVLNPVGDISHLKTIKKIIEQKEESTVKEKLGLVDSISSNHAANPLDSLPSAQWQKQLVHEDLDFSSISFTGEVSNDPYEYDSYLMEDIENLEFDIEKIEQEAALYEEAKEKEIDRLLVGGDNEEDFMLSRDGTMSSSDSFGIGNMFDNQFQNIMNQKGQMNIPPNPQMIALEKSYKEFLSKSSNVANTIKEQDKSKTDKNPKRS